MTPRYDSFLTVPKQELIVFTHFAFYFSALYLKHLAFVKVPHPRRCNCPQEAFLDLVWNGAMSGWTHSLRKAWSGQFSTTAAGTVYRYTQLLRLLQSGYQHIWKADFQLSNIWCLYMSQMVQDDLKRKWQRVIYQKKGLDWLIWWYFFHPEKKSRTHIRIPDISLGDLIGRKSTKSRYFSNAQATTKKRFGVKRWSSYARSVTPGSVKVCHGGMGVGGCDRSEWPTPLPWVCLMEQSNAPWRLGLNFPLKFRST